MNGRNVKKNRQTALKFIYYAYMYGLSDNTKRSCYTHPVPWAVSQMLRPYRTIPRCSWPWAGCCHRPRSTGPGGTAGSSPSSAGRALGCRCRPHTGGGWHTLCPPGSSDQWGRGRCRGPPSPPRSSNQRGRSDTLLSL